MTTPPPRPRPWSRRSPIDVEPPDDSGSGERGSWWDRNQPDRVVSIYFHDATDRSYPAVQVAVERPEDTADPDC